MTHDNKVELRATPICKAWQRIFLKKWGKRYRINKRARSDKGKVKGLVEQSRRWFKKQRRTALEKIPSSQQSVGEMKFVINPSKSIKFLQWKPGAKRTAKMDRVLNKFQKRHDKRLAVEERRKIQLQRNKPVFSLMPSEAAALATRNSHQKVAVAMERKACEEVVRSQKNVFVHASAADEVNAIEWPSHLKQVTALITADVVITTSLKHCSAKLRVSVSQLPGHILWAKAMGLRVAVPKRLSVDAVESLETPGLSLQFKPIAQVKQLCVYVNKTVSKASFEMRTLDHAMGVGGSKWIQVATAAEYNKLVKTKLRKCFT